MPAIQPIHDDSAARIRRLETTAQRLLELARAATIGAQIAIDEGREDAPLAASIAKAKAGRVAELAVQEAVQMHGGVGMTDAFDVGLFMKRVRVLNELLGDAGFHAEGVARAQGF